MSILQAPEAVVLSFGRGVGRAEVTVFPSVGLFRCLFFPLFPVVGILPLGWRGKTDPRGSGVVSLAYLAGSRLVRAPVSKSKLEVT